MSDEVQIWKPQQEFAGSDLVPELRPGGQLVETAPGGLMGRENVEPEDLVLPSLLLRQGKSDPGSEQVPNAQPGQFWLATAGEVIEPPLRLLIVHHSRSRALFPQPGNPRTSGLNKCLARDAMTGTEYGACEDCPHKRWGERNEAPACAESHNFVAWTNFGPCVVRFAKSSFKAARNYLTTWTMSSKNLWAHPAIVTVKKQQKALSDGQQANYFTMDMRWDQREDVPPEFQENAVELYKQIQQAHETGRFKTEDEASHDE